MVIKRKRSESELSSFSSAYSSPTRPGSQSIDTLSIGQINWGAVSSRSSTPNHLPSRTMKRFRDNRPSESEVHQRTLNLLYSAQQRQQHESPIVEIQTDAPADMSEAPAAEAQTHQSSNQRSLHSFWALPSPASSLGGSPPHTPAVHSTMPASFEFSGVGRHVEFDMAMELDSHMS